MDFHYGGFTFVEFLMPLMFLLVFGLILFSIIRSAIQGAKNRNSPRLTVPAIVSAKRAEVSGGAGDMMASTDYYATFEVESGDRLEFAVNGKEYGQLADGDIGNLTFQGTRFIGFSRTGKAGSNS